MSAYKDFVRDFPSRCLDIMRLFANAAREHDREVTLLLAMATPSVILPFERLHKDAHPSKDQTRFSDAKLMLDCELKRPCKDSRVFAGLSSGEWRYKKLHSLQGDPDAWNLKTDCKPISEKQLGTIIGIIRNALAHGNIWTTGKPINTIVFVSLVSQEQRDGPFNSLQCSPEIFAEFVKHWVSFLADLKLPGDVFVETKTFEEPVA